MNNELLEQVSFTLDLLNLDRKLDCNEPSIDDDASRPVYVVEEALRSKGVRAPVDKIQK
jgi:hypothetical protein